MLPFVRTAMLSYVLVFLLHTAKCCPLSGQQNAAIFNILLNMEKSFSILAHHFQYHGPIIFNIMAPSFSISWPPIFSISWPQHFQYHGRNIFNIMPAQFSIFKNQLSIPGLGFSKTIFNIINALDIEKTADIDL
jgi:hypothetical protein